MSRSRAWCITVNNYSENDEARCREVGRRCVYAIFGREEAPTTNTRHLQGYVYYPNARTFESVRKQLPRGSHIEAAKGTPAQNREYCSKSAQFEEYGQLPTQGSRSDLQKAIHMLLDERRSLREVATETPAVFVYAHRGLEKLRNLLAPVQPRCTRSDVFILVGPTRTGKSRLARAFGERCGDLYYKNRSNWWHNYQQQPVVIIDDFYGWLAWDELLKLCDRYPYKVETKGSHEEFTSELIIITSNRMPHDWYKFTGYDPSPLLSDRINCIAEFYTAATPRIEFYYNPEGHQRNIDFESMLLSNVPQPK
ncbi:replication-associated protein [Caesalpinia ferrea associated virus]|uniref:Replication-associated protein n=1 Tax=Caesalpinia ferrea associated virus TaxID=2771212 RepID=A0A7S6KV07_9CIRC|nr:replication-associated protein [Caesalpinia ferrea associated virus]QNT09336.1 replication-associated protein [Caesalpinia ferrea associated virus]